MRIRTLLSPGNIVWSLGKYTVAFNVMMMIMTSFYHTFVVKDGHTAKMSGWSDAMKNKVLQMYLCLSSSYLLMCLSVAASSKSWLVGKMIGIFPKHAVVTSIVLIYLLTSTLESVPQRPPNKVMRGICWGLHAVVMGPCFSLFGSQVCLTSAIYTALAILLANFLALSNNTESYNQVKIQVSLLYLLVSITTGLCLVYLPPLNDLSSALVALNIFGGITLYFGMYVTNVQAAIRDMKYNEVDPLYAAAVIFVNTLNLFFRIAFFHVVEYSGLLPSSQSVKCRQ